MKSAEEKIANKEASLLRRAAHTARCKELKAELGKVNVSDLERAAEEASAAAELAIKVRNDEADAIRAQIAALQEQLNLVDSVHAERVNATNMARKEAYEALNAERDKQVSMIEARYPDLSGDARYYVGGWVPPAGYIEKFAADNADELAKKKAKREAKAKK